MNLPRMKNVIDGKLYDTSKATVIASDCYWDGHNFERNGRNTYLLKTKKGNYFVVHLTLWEAEKDTLYPVGKDDAKGIYERLPEQEVEYEVAFDEEPEEA